MDKLETTIKRLQEYGISFSAMYRRLNVEKHVFDKWRSSRVQSSRDAAAEKIEAAFKEALDAIGIPKPDLVDQKVQKLEIFVEFLQEMIRNLWLNISREV